MSERKKSSSRFLYGSGDQMQNIDDHWVLFEQNLPRILFEIQAARSAENAAEIHKMILQDLAEIMPAQISISYSFGEINGIPLEEAINRIEFYISPNCNKENVPILLELYKSFPVRLRSYNIDFIKYRVYNKHNISREVATLPKKLRQLYKNLSYLAIDGRDETGAPIVHLVVFFNKHASVAFSEREISFETGEKRKTWLCQDIAPLFVAAIGEENFMYNIGYIEYLPLEECKTVDELKPIKTLVEHMEYVRNLQGMISCCVCGRTPRQVALKRCGACKKIYYCGQTCQRINYKDHKNICI
jgi:hypothetical protein